MDTQIIFIRIAITFICALIFGIERQKSHKPVGFGTFIFVSTGATTLAIIAQTISSINPTDNPIPLLAAIVTGIGFLGAGALIKTSDKIFGFTTAAGVWVFAIFGLAIGIGEYLVALILYLAIWTTVGCDWYLEHKGIGTYQKKLTIITNKVVEEDEIRNAILKTGIYNMKLIFSEYDKMKNIGTFSYLLEGKKDEVKKIPLIFYDIEWFNSCKIE